MKISALTDEDEDVIWCKQSLIRVMGLCAIHTKRFLQKLEIELSDLEVVNDSADQEAITYLLRMVQVYMEEVL